jgi:hypothetical protein
MVDFPAGNERMCTSTAGRLVISNQQSTVPGCLVPIERGEMPIR